MRLRRLVSWLPLTLLAALAGIVPAAGAATARPNVVVIETDDQTVADLASMPHTRRLIGGAGATFANAVVSLSQCCPSRATFLTGRYAHNHGVLTTQPPFGGFPAFDDAESLAVWLRRAGYATALVGKYLNGYGRDDPTYVPPGWSDWHALLGPSTYRFTGFRLNDDGRVRAFPGSYQSDVLAARSERFVRRAAAAHRPFFLWTTYVAPHIGSPHDLRLPPGARTAVPSPLFADALLGVRMPRSPAFDEADVSDKPADIRRRRPLRPREEALLEAIWRKRQQALQSVDWDVLRMVRTLRRAGVLDDTLLIFTSDNGFLLGEHRVRESKVLPYEPSIRVPLLLRGPGIPRGVTRDQLVWNGDLAPTILAATGARAAWPTDGRSLWPFLRDGAARSDRAVLLEGPPHGRRSSAPRFTGLRTRGHLYVEHLGGEIELYDLRRDPFELDNLAGRPEAAALQTRLSRRLARLRHCAGAACR